jgi:MarR family transcriptional regulator, temperature-dependent positive regulator of motility
MPPCSLNLRGTLVLVLSFKSVIGQVDHAVMGCQVPYGTSSHSLAEPIVRTESPVAKLVPGRPEALNRTDIDPVTMARLWDNPCWFAFRFNYLALRYNIPLYGWVEREFGLPRPEYVVVYSLGLRDGVTARDISVSYGFPKNSLSRAINALERKGLIARKSHPADKRSFLISLTPAGRRLFDKTLPRFVAVQDEMLKVLSSAELTTLSVLLAKIVLGTFDASASEKKAKHASSPGGGLNDLPGHAAARRINAAARRSDAS